MRSAVADALRALRIAASHPSAVRLVLQHLGAGYGRPAVRSAVEALAEEERGDDQQGLALGVG